MKSVFDIQTWSDKFGEGQLNVDKLKEYLEFVQQAENKRDPSRYSEWHHVMPKCIDKSQEYVKYVHLNGADHFRAHLMLVECFIGNIRYKLSYALTRMLKPETKVSITSEEYETARRLSREALVNRVVSKETRRKLSIARRRVVLPEDFGKRVSESKKGKFTGENNPFYGKNHSDDTKSKISETKRGCTCYHNEEGQNIFIKEGDKVPGGFVIGKFWSDEALKSLSETHKRENLSEETLIRMSESRIGSNNPMYGKTLSEEQKKVISDKLSGEGNPMYGKHHRQETLQKISDTLSDGRLKGENNPMYGRVRITDGISNKTISKDDSLPEGWRYGMTTVKCKKKVGG